MSCAKRPVAQVEWIRKAPATAVTVPGFGRLIGVDMADAICSIQECDLPAVCRGWCPKHYTRWKRHRDPNYYVPRPVGCSVDGCEGEYEAKGLCRNHYERERYRLNAGKPRTSKKCTIEGCDRWHYGHGWCQMHYHRWRNTGDPLRNRKDFQHDQMFDSKLVRHGECLIYTGQPSRGLTQHRTISINKRLIGAHRYAWERVHGPIPDGMWVLHKCDVPPCCNPEHLFLGSPLDNVRDKIQKGRARSIRGSQIKNAKLSEWKVRQIKWRLVKGEPAKLIARDYGVCYEVIRRVKVGQTWAHVPTPEVDPA